MADFRKPRKYQVVYHTATRLRNDPTCPDFVEFVAGDIVQDTDVPKHTPIDDWVSTGHWVPVEEQVTA